MTLKELWLAALNMPFRKSSGVSLPECDRAFEDVGEVD